MTEALAPLADIPFIVLAARMAAVALFVTLVALLSERVGPFLGAMVATLPLYTGPIYLFLAIDHSPEYLAQVAVSSAASSGIIPVFILAYALMARAGHAMLPSLLIGLSAWVACAVFVQIYDWSLVEALLFALPIYGISICLSSHFTDAVALTPNRRSWLDLPLRIILVSGVVGIVIASSPFMSERFTGIVSTMPIIMISLIVVLHPRIGGRATAALLAHSVSGMFGLLFAVTLIGYTIVPWGPTLALPAALLVAICWNLMLIALKRARTSQRRVPSADSRGQDIRTAPAHQRTR